MNKKPEKRAEPQVSIEITDDGFRDNYPINEIAATPLPDDPETRAKTDIVRRAIGRHPSVDISSMKMFGGIMYSEKVPVKKRPRIAAGDVDMMHTPRYDEVDGSGVTDGDLAAVREAVQITDVPGVTMVTAVVSSLVDDNNQILGVRCQGGQALGGFIHDQGQDAYLVRGVAVFDVGVFNFVFRATVPGVADWSQILPVPAVVLERHMSAAQRKLLEAYRQQYPADQYRVQFVQMVNVN